jgi:hypothetical protein
MIRIESLIGPNAGTLQSGLLGLLIRQALGHFPQDCFCSRSRVRSLSDRTADDQVTGAAAQGFSWGGDALLVGGLGSGGPDAGNDENRFRAGKGANPGYLLGRADEAVQAGFEGHPDEEFDLIGGLPRDAGGEKLRRVDAGKDGDGEELRRVWNRINGGLGRGQHSRSTGSVQGDHACAKGRRRAHRSGDRIGNVVELEVEENGKSTLEDRLERGRTGSDEQLEADLEPAATTVELADKGFSIRSSGGIEGNDEPPPRLFPGVKIDLARCPWARFGLSQTWHN